MTDLQRMTDLLFYSASGLPSMVIVTRLVISVFEMRGVRRDVRDIRAELAKLRNTS